MKPTSVRDHHSSVSMMQPKGNKAIQNVNLMESVQSNSGSLQNMLTFKGYQTPTRLSNALQGSVWESTKNDESVVIKAISKVMHHKHIAFCADRAVHIKENIVKETSILKYLSQNNPPSSLVKFVECFEDLEHYYLVMENGGSNLFSFVKRCHHLIQNKFLPLSAWKAFCKIAMQQMVDLMNWMHNSMKCCHLDISLENFVIQNVNVVSNPKANTIVRFEENFVIKIVDFGLAEVFDKRDKTDFVDFQCNKFVGKTGYKSPEVTAELGMFDARSADCWSLGVCFFILVLGFPPFQKASSEDAFFRAVLNGELLSILRGWNRADYVDSAELDLIHKIFVPEKYRVNIKEIQKHPYFLL